jgi:NCS2 family nucleobase:cation symporter-2
MDGVPHMGQAIPMALQHVIAMIVGCVTPAIIVSGAAGISASDRVLLIQTSLIVSALTTFLQLFPIGKRNGFHLGAGLPVIFGVSFAYVPSMTAIAEGYGIGAILGAQIIGGICAFIVGLTIKKIRNLFPPLIAGAVVFTIGLSLYPTAISYMAGGAGQASFGSWQNWLVALFTLTVVTILNHFAKGILKLASLLVGMLAGYIFSMIFGMVNFANVASAGFFSLPQPMHFGIKFEISACVAIAILFIVNSVQAIGDFSAMTSGGLDREPTSDELQGAILGLGVSNIIGAVLGCLPTSTYGQNVGIVTTTKVVNRITLGIAGLIILIAGIFPKFSALLTTIPYSVLGGATVSVFASISMTGLKLITSEEMNYRNTSIVGLAVALGMGISQVSASLASFPPWVTTVFGKSPVVVTTIVAIFLNICIPKMQASKDSVELKTQHTDTADIS